MKSNTFIRVKWIDYAKVLCIFLMIVGHTKDINQDFRSFFYYFHMPVFFMISGFLFKKNDLLTVAKQLIIPLLFFNFLNWIPYAIKLIYTVDDIDINILIIKPFLGIFFHDNVHGIPMAGPFWFVLVIFIHRLIFGVSSKRIYIYALICISLVLSFFINKNDDYFYYFLIQRTILSIPLFGIGYVVKDLKFLKTIDVKNINQIGIVLISCFILIMIYIFNGKVDIYNCKLGNPILYYLGSVLGIVMVVFISNLISKVDRFYEIIKKYSNGTLVILGTHFFLLYVINKALNYKIIFPNDSVLKSIIIMIMLYYPIIFFLNKIPYLIGKTTRKK